MLLTEFLRSLNSFSMYSCKVAESWFGLLGDLFIRNLCSLTYFLMIGHRLEDDTCPGPQDQQRSEQPGWGDWCCSDQQRGQRRILSQTESPLMWPDFLQVIQIFGLTLMSNCLSEDGMPGPLKGVSELMKLKAFSREVKEIIADLGGNLFFL